MKINDFEFEATSLSGMRAENEICQRCGLKYCDTSCGIPNEFEIGRYYHIHISAPDGKASCCVTTYQNPKSEKEEYIFCVSSVEVERKNR